MGMGGIYTSHIDCLDDDMLDLDSRHIVSTTRTAAVTSNKSPQGYKIITQM